jgi:hypothetical protein
MPPSDGAVHFNSPGRQMKEEEPASPAGVLVALALCVFLGGKSAGCWDHKTKPLTREQVETYMPHFGQSVRPGDVRDLTRTEQIMLTLPGSPIRPDLRGLTPQEAYDFGVRAQAKAQELAKE